jgi:lysyl-tRNA synthetase, class II
MSYTTQAPAPAPAPAQAQAPAPAPTDLASYFEQRLSSVADYGNEERFPNDFKSTVTVPYFRETWAHLADEQVDNAIRISLTGRIDNKRLASKSLIFLDVDGDTMTKDPADFQKLNHFQLLLSKNAYQADQVYGALDFNSIRNTVNRGDLIGVVGYPHRTKRGELSILCLGIRILAPCLHEIPHELKDRKLVDRMRYLHFIVNKEARVPIMVRAKFLRAIRNFLAERGFMELETPMLEHGTGANAAPFITRYNALDSDVNLRVAPELYLKRAVIAGFGKVFEIGKQFRNEGQDTTHNPEFTTCEFYYPYATMSDLIPMTEDLLYALSLEAGTSLQGGVNWSPPYNRVDIIPALEKKLGCTLAPPYLQHNLISITQAAGIELPSTIGAQLPTVAKLFDNLISELLEPECLNPTFLCGHPMVMCPLAKPDSERPHLAQRFELFVKGMELCNAYSELNNPVLQRSTLKGQDADRLSGDTETIHDESYCEAMEYGLPPTAGWGIGIDRALMLMLGVERIGDTMIFQLSRAAAAST